MGNPNLNRVQAPEGAYTFTKDNTAKLIKEIDMRVMSADCWSTITRSGGVITLIEFFSDSGKTVKVMERQYSYVTVGTVKYLSQILTIIYNADTTEDSRVTTTINRDGNQLITGCDSPFTTLENDKLC